MGVVEDGASVVRIAGVAATQIDPLADFKPAAVGTWLCSPLSSTYFIGRRKGILRWRALFPILDSVIFFEKMGKLFPQIRSTQIKEFKDLLAILFPDGSLHPGYEFGAMLL
jgi:hypothetical protein